MEHQSYTSLLVSLRSQSRPIFKSCMGNVLTKVLSSFTLCSSNYWNSKSCDIVVAFQKDARYEIIQSMTKINFANVILFSITVHFGYSGHYDIVATCPGTKYINIFYYIQVRYSGQSDIVARKQWPNYIRSALYSKKKKTLYSIMVYLNSQQPFRLVDVHG